MYLGIYNRKKNKKITFGIWDLDSTCGRRWDSSEIDPSQDYTEYITANEHGDYNLFRRMKMLNADAFNDRVKSRYTELRGKALHTDSIVKRFTDYKDLFELSGATVREENRWSDTDAGTLVNASDVQAGVTRLTGLDKGFYIVSGRKALVR